MQDRNSEGAQVEGPPAPLPDDVVVTVGDYPAGAQICVRHRSWGVEVDYRDHGMTAWSPVQFWGGSVELRPQTVQLLPCQEDVGRTDEVRTGATVTVIHGGAA